MAERMALTGNDAGAHALRQINPDVVAAFPITPQTDMMHTFAGYVADGKVDTEFVRVESEHSAQSAVVGASLSGARACTATSSAGLALMWEILYVAASCRCPLLMPVVNRALSAPINIHCDHSDSMGARDTGWIQLYAENSQEAYDNAIQAVRVAEHPDVRLPTMVPLDGFILSHTMEGLEVNDDADVNQFIGEYEPEGTLLDVDDPETFGMFALPNYYYEFKKQQVDAMQNALDVVKQVGKEYGEMTGRSYGLVEGYRTDDADVVLTGLGSTMGTAKQAADDLREDEGIKAGVAKIRCYRPFPTNALNKVLNGSSIIGVMDRAVSFGLGGPLFHEIRSHRFNTDTPMKNFIYGLGGRDLSLDEAKDIFRSLAEADASGELGSEVEYLQVRE